MPIYQSTNVGAYDMVQVPMYIFVSRGAKNRNSRTIYGRAIN